MKKVKKKAKSAKFEYKFCVLNVLIFISCCQCLEALQFP